MSYGTGGPPKGAPKRSSSLTHHSIQRADRPSSGSSSARPTVIEVHGGCVAYLDFVTLVASRRRKPGLDLTVQALSLGVTQQI